MTLSPQYPNGVEASLYIEPNFGSYQMGPTLSGQANPVERVTIVIHELAKTTGSTGMQRSSDVIFTPSPRKQCHRLLEALGSSWFPFKTIPEKIGTSFQRTPNRARGLRIADARQQEVQQGDQDAAVHDHNAPGLGNGMRRPPSDLPFPPPFPPFFFFFFFHTAEGINPRHMLFENEFLWAA